MILFLALIQTALVHSGWGEELDTSINKKIIELEQIYQEEDKTIQVKDIKTSGITNTWALIVYDVKNNKKKAN